MIKAKLHLDSARVTMNIGNDFDELIKETEGLEHLTESELKLILNVLDCVAFRNLEKINEFDLVGC